MKVRNSFERERVSVSEFGQSMTVASEAPACEIQSILAAHVRGMAVSVNSASPQFLDCTSVKDFQSAQDTIIKAREAFEALPSSVRARFSNDPVKMLQFVADPSNIEEAATLGLLSKDALERLEAKKKPTAVTPPEGA